MQSVGAKEQENSFPYVCPAKTNMRWQLNHRRNLDVFNTGAGPTSQHKSFERQVADNDHKLFALESGKWL